MALSNWATLAWDENGEPCDGRLEAEGISIAIYKNWIYVRDEKAWKLLWQHTFPKIKKKLKQLIGIGAYGYDGDGNYVRLLSKALKNLKQDKY